MIIPIEVKAGASGSLKSLHYFLQEKHLEIGVRVSGHLPNITAETATLATGEKCNYKLLSLPLYLVEELSRILSNLS